MAAPHGRGFAGAFMEAVLAVAPSLSEAGE